MFSFIFPEDEKMEKAQSGHEHKQKDQLKKTVQDHSQIRDQQKGEGSGFGELSHGLKNLLGLENWRWRTEVRVRMLEEILQRL